MAPIVVHAGSGGVADSTLSGYMEDAGFGGPKTVGAQLASDNEKKELYFRAPIRVFKGWFDWKAGIYEKYGIQLGINYSAVYVNSSEVVGNAQHWAAGGIFDVQLGWTLVNRGSDNPGTLFFKFASRHKIASDSPPMFHGFDSGYLGLPAVGYNDYTVRFNELNWQQALFDKRLTVVAGKVDPTNYFTFHGLIVPWRNYMNYGFSVSGTVNWPDMGWGVIAGGLPHPNIYVTAAVTDARGDVYKDGDLLYGGDNFFSGRFFSAIEVGYVPSFDERYFRKASVTAWHTDAFTEDGSGALSAEGSGVAFASHWFFQEKYIPFVLFGFSDGNGVNTFYKRQFSVGNGFRFLSHDILGVGFTWAETPIPGADKQLGAEVYYRFTVTEHLEVTPDFQYIKNPALSPDKDSLFYFGLRGRITL
jgi:porin